MAYIQVKTIIFDLAEVILQGLVGIERRVNQIIDAKDRVVSITDFHGPEFLKLISGKISETEYWFKVIENNKYPETINGHKTIDQLKIVVRRNFQEITGTMAVLKKLKIQGFDLILLSDHAREWIEYCEQQFPLAQFFPLRIYSYQTSKTKADPFNFLLAIKRANANPKTTLFIDDQYRNLLVARQEPVNIKHVYQFKTAADLKQDLAMYNIKIS